MTLTENTITFGKYKNQNIVYLLRDRKYCAWLCTQDWFCNNYKFLYDKLSDYNPSIDFFNIPDCDTDNNTFLYNYKYFNLVSVNDLAVTLTPVDKECYIYYYSMIESFKNDILERLENDEEQPYDIKVPKNWLNTFESKCGIPRSSFKEFIDAYDLINIPYIIEDIKKQAGLVYKGARSWLLAKERSLQQEKWWEDLLEAKYGNSVGTQFKYGNCIFDFIVIRLQLVFECKIGLKDFNEKQHNKYKIALSQYNIVYLVDYDCVIDMQRRVIYTSEEEKYTDYIINSIKSLKEPSYLDILIKDFTMVYVPDITEIFSKFDFGKKE